MAMRVLRGASGGSGLGVVVGEADVPSGVIYRVSGPAGPAGRPGVDAGGALTGAGLAALVSGAPVKGLPVDADVLPLLDSAASGGLARLSLAGLKAAISGAFVTLSGRQTVADKTFVAPRVSGSATVPASIVVDGSDANIGLDLRGKGTGRLTYMGAAVVTDAVVHGSSLKAAPVDADELALLDSADSFKVKRFSWASLKAAILAWFGPVTATLSNKTLTAPKVTGTTAVAGTVTVSSADPNVSLNLVSKGTGKVQVNGVEAVGTTSAQSLSHKTLVTPTITNPTLSSPVIKDGIIYTDGTAANVNLSLYAKGGGKILFTNANGPLAYFQNVPNTVNRIGFFSAAAGKAPFIQPGDGTTTANIDLDLRPAGSGSVNVSGAPVASRVAVPPSANAYGKPGHVAADANFIYAYTGDGTTHSWVRSAAATW